MRYANAAGTEIVVDDGDVMRIIPVDTGNADYVELVAAGAAIEPFVPLAPGVADVRAVASRRICHLVGARDAEHLQVVIANASREAIRLLRIKAARPWTDAEAERAASLEAADAAIEAVRAASNLLEALQPVPEDYAAAHRWPPLPGFGGGDAAASVSGEQLLKAMALHGLLATPDVLAALGGGGLPSLIEGAVAALPEDHQSAVRAALAPGGEFTRGGSPLAWLCGALDLSAADIDSLWAVAEATQGGGA